MTEKEVIIRHLTMHNATVNPVQFASFTAALRDARGITIRDPDTGVLKQNASHGHVGSWLEALGYLVFLDHIGICFKRKDAKELPPETSSLVKGSDVFSQLENKKSRRSMPCRCCAFLLMNMASQSFHRNPLASTSLCCHRRLRRAYQVSSASLERGFCQCWT